MCLERYRAFISPDRDRDHIQQEAPLEVLELNDIDLYDRGFQLYPWININELTSLKLINCARIQPLLMDYAQLLQNSGTAPQLQILQVKHSVSDPGIDIDPMFAIESVLRAAEGLQDIFVFSNFFPSFATDTYGTPSQHTRFFIRFASSTALTTHKVPLQLDVPYPRPGSQSYKRFISTL
jgi:hypothetical protein